MIQNRAMLATLSISAWTARKQDKTVSAEVEKAHGAHDAGKYNKLLVNKALLDPISKLSARIRESHYFSTHAWSDSGARLLPSKLFADYTTRMRVFKSDFDRLVNDMVNQYPAEVQAARVRLGSMYNPGDYPEAWELRDRFAINLEFSPVPDAADFRVDLAEDAQEELRASVTRGVAARQEEAVKATYRRIYDVVSKIEERLGTPDAVFKDSLIGNASELCDVLDGLNITDDPQITQVCHEIRAQLLVPPALLRSSASARAAAAVAAGHILLGLPRG